MILNMTIQNNVTRFLVSQKIEFMALESESIKRSAQETANLFHLDPNIVYKTIVVCRFNSGKNLLIVTPGPLEVDLKKVAALIHEKKVRIPTQKEAEAITKLQAGGISPIALLNHGFEIFIHQTIKNQSKIAISGGQRGLTILLSANDFLRITKAKIADVASPDQKDNSDL
jgi:Cys-tRNA(Pro)/Cys-tRNA(Cys) deacylase